MSEKITSNSIQDRLEHVLQKATQHPADQILVDKHPKLQLELLAGGYIQNTFTTTELKKVREHYQLGQRDLIVANLENNLALPDSDSPMSDKPFQLKPPEITNWTKRDNKISEMNYERKQLLDRFEAFIQELQNNKGRTSIKKIKLLFAELRNHKIITMGQKTQLDLFIKTLTTTNSSLSHRQIQIISQMHPDFTTNF